MPRREPEPTAPDRLEVLPFAGRLEPGPQHLEPEGDHSWRQFDGLLLENLDAGGSRFEECAFTSVTVTGGRMRGSRLREVWWHDVRLVGVDLVDGDWMDVAVRSGVLAGVELFGSRWHRVVLQGCKLDSVNLRDATLREVSFVDCLLRDVDLAGGALTDVQFPGTQVRGLRLDGARLARVDLRSVVELDIASGHAALRGAVIDSGQLAELAPYLATEIGLTVDDG
jgi:uncharacterized protein YjbI with pentapeptide repeats